MIRASATAPSTGRAKVLLQSALPRYRGRLVRELLNDPDFTILTGSSQFDDTVRLGIEADGHAVKVVKNAYLLGRRLLWQSGVVRPGLHARLAIVELNPRVLTTWVVLLLRRGLGRPTIAWGHAYPRKGPNQGTDRIRSLQRSLASSLLVYTESEVADLQARGYRYVTSVNNGLYYGREVTPAIGHEKADIIYAGRLVSSKRAELLLRAFSATVVQNDRYRNLHIVGTGPEEDRLKRLASELRLTGRVYFHGEVFSYDSLRCLYAASLVAVSPGYAGLNVIQALSFGVPIIVADDEPHAPEIEALVPGLNGLMFEARSVSALVKALEHVANDPQGWVARAGDIAEHCRTRYTVDAMTQAFRQEMERYL